MIESKIGVFICYCGGNISDYVDVEKVRNAVESESGVVIAKTHMFTCSDAAQQEMIEDIQNSGLDGLVVASCSPKLHLFTFRSMAERAGLNPYQYVQVNLREQCSWAHREDPATATIKAIRLVRAGIAKARLTKPLSTMRIETKPKVLVVGAGVAGLRAALAISDLGLSVFIIEKSPKAGGWTEKWATMFLHDQRGFDIISNLLKQVQARGNITLFTNAELEEKTGSVGDFLIRIKAGGGEIITLEAGAIIVATGFEAYEPCEGEFGYGQEGIIRLPEFKELTGKSNGGLMHNGNKVKDIVYIYCVGSRQGEGGENPYCSRYCCNATVHEAICAYELDPDIHQFHLFRNMRTYGKHEVLYEQAAKAHSIFIRYEDDDPPLVERADNRLQVKVNDQLLGGETVEIGADLVVLVTGMVPRQNDKLIDILKLPVGTDGFFNEIHPKLRPVETTVDGVFIAGAAQGPKTMAESVASALAGVSKSAALLMKGYTELDPFVATIDPNLCSWCDACSQACPYEAIEKMELEGKEAARVIQSSCKGGGACVTVCPENAINLEGYTDQQIKATIEALSQET